MDFAERRTACAAQVTAQLSLSSSSLTALQLLELMPQCGLHTKGFSQRELQRGLSQD